VDYQVKLRGYRIEPGEIEEVLREAPGVGDAVVLVREDRLAAYLVSAEGKALIVAEVRAYAGSRLPEYMVPAGWVTLQALPLTDNGKLDRRALPAPELRVEEYVAPRTPTEVAVAGIWAETLGVERVGAHDNFFELGGHSLRATRVVSRIRETFGVQVPLRALFESPTVAACALEIDRALAAAATEAVPSMVSRGRLEEMLEADEEMSEEELDRLLNVLSAEEEQGW
jgi:acyl carrier protein